MGHHLAEKAVSRFPVELAYQIRLRPSSFHIRRFECKEISPETYDTAFPGLHALMDNSEHLQSALYALSNRVLRNDHHALIIGLLEHAVKFQVNLHEFAHMYKDIAHTPAEHSRYTSHDGVDTRRERLYELRETLKKHQATLEAYPLHTEWDRNKMKHVARHLALSSALMVAAFHE